MTGRAVRAGRPGAWLVALLALALWAAACDAGTSSAPSAPEAAAGPLNVRAEIAGRRFDLELAADPVSRHRGLGGRSRVPEHTGMLFAFRSEAPRTFVMRDCPIPIDVAFLDSEGRVVSVHTMPVEPPRAPHETPFAYEARLPGYSSGAPARYAVEVAGGTFRELGLRPGDRVEFDRAAVLSHTR